VPRRIIDGTAGARIYRGPSTEVMPRSSEPRHESAPRDSGRSTERSSAPAHVERSSPSHSEPSHNSSPPPQSHDSGSHESHHDSGGGHVKRD
jgi:hypothetical protein